MSKKLRGSLSDFAARKGQPGASPSPSDASTGSATGASESPAKAAATIAPVEPVEKMSVQDSSANVLVADEGQRLAHLEQAIGDNLQAFYKVGCALREIRDSRLYKVLGYSRFEDYCAERWDISKMHAFRLEAASAVVDNLKNVTNLVTFLPTNESQVRPLAALPPEQQRQAWKKVIEAAPVIREKPKITAKLVEDTVAEVTGQTKTPKEKPAGVRASFHFSEELDDALSESLYRVRKMVGKERKAAVSKDLIAEAILQHGLAELEARGEGSPLWKEIEKRLK